MHIQVMAYPMLGSVLSVQVTSAEPGENGHSWSHLVLEQLELGALDPDDAWDLVWAVGHLMCERALERQSRR